MKWIIKNEKILVFIIYSFMLIEICFKFSCIKAYPISIYIISISLCWLFTNFIYSKGFKIFKK